MGILNQFQESIDSGLFARKIREHSLPPLFLTGGVFESSGADDYAVDNVSRRLPLEAAPRHPVEDSAQ